MRAIYFDCIAGASGDMIIGALIDAGLPVERLREALAAIPLAGYELRADHVSKNGFGATKFDVVVHDHVHGRALSDILELISASELSDAIKTSANAIFTRIGEVEAGIHGVDLASVHLHELGGIDTIVDVVGALCGLQLLGIERVYCSPLPMGRGFVQGAHGQIPLPAPAALALLRGAPIVGSTLAFELVTPTAAALLSSLAIFGDIPSMMLGSVGYGAGSHDLPIPNLLRVLVGEEDGLTSESLMLLETNIDDLNPELYEYVMSRLFGARALDVYLTPIQMKKNRPAALLSVLCHPVDVDNLTSILIAETTTLGVRKSVVQRVAVPRWLAKVDTIYGPVQVKVADAGGGRRKAAPEYEACRKIAEEQGVPLRDVYRAAESASQALLDPHA